LGNMKLLNSALLVFVLCVFVACSTMGGKNGEPEGGPSDDLPTDQQDPTASTIPAWKKAREAQTEASGVGCEDDEVSEDGDENLAGSSFPDEDPSEQTDERAAQRTLDEALEFCQTAQDFWSKGDFENAIASLDQAYALILQADTGEQPKLIQQKEDIRFMISKRMLEIYASQSTVVNGNHEAIPMDMNSHVEKEIKSFQGIERDFFLEAYKRSGKYRGHIVTALKEAGMPEELSWLPLIESGFKVKALSTARALGMWQFIPSTGYKFGLQRNEWIDERMDVAKSTQAAIAYMQELHQLFGDWSTVLAAYNCGEFRVLSVIRKQNINYLDNFWDLFQRLPWETARYVPRFLAVLHIIKDPAKFGFDLAEPDPPLEYETVTIAKQMELKDIAKALSVCAEDLEKLNAELRQQVTVPEEYELKVPNGKGPQLLASLEDIPVYAPPRKSYEYHRVRPGQTLSQLARKYGTSVQAIMQANGLKSQNRISVGRQLKIPVRGTSRPVALAPRPARSDTTPTAVHHRVRRGDSLWLVARAYNTTTQEIMRMNNLKTTRLHVGQTLIVRQGVAEEKIQEKTKAYRVKTGDSPYQIATAHEMKLERFLRLNQLTPRSRIYPGQKLLVDAAK
jgi:membrane-bound lytic murein transglycosylase D